MEPKRSSPRSQERVARFQEKSNVHMHELMGVEQYFAS
jgi:hypothetical protein